MFRFKDLGTQKDLSVIELHTQNTNNKISDKTKTKIITTYKEWIYTQIVAYIN